MQEEKHGELETADDQELKFLSSLPSSCNYNDLMSLWNILAEVFGKTK